MALIFKLVAEPYVVSDSVAEVREILYLMGKVEISAQGESGSK